MPSSPASATSVITSAVGHSISIGTLSRIEHGNAEVPLLWAWALQDATKNACFDSYRAQTHDAPANACPYDLIGEISKEHGEAVEAGLKAARSSSDTSTTQLISTSRFVPFQRNL